MPGSHLGQLPAHVHDADVPAAVRRRGDAQARMAVVLVVEPVPRLRGLAGRVQPGDRLVDVQARPGASQQPQRGRLGVMPPLAVLGSQGLAAGLEVIVHGVPFPAFLRRMVIRAPAMNPASKPTARPRSAYRKYRTVLTRAGPWGPATCSPPFMDGPASGGSPELKQPHASAKRIPRTATYTT